MIENVLDKKGLVYYDSKSKKYIKDEISKTRKYCFVGSDDPNTSGWYKFASQTMNGWGDTNVTFMITSTFDKYYSGILQLQVRLDIVEDKSTQVSCPVLRWHTRIGFNPEDVMIAIDGNTYSLYVNKQCEQYGRIMAEVISESNINTSDSRIELHNSTAPETEMPEQEKTWLAKDGATVKVSNSTNQVNQIKLTDEDLDELRPDNFTMYYAAGNNSVVNSPLDAGSAFALAVYRSAAGYRTQEITSLYGVKKVRYYNASVWSEWKTLAYEYGNTAILTSSGYSKYKGMYTKFATIRLNGAWSRCIGVFNVIDTESYELYGQLSFNVSTRENVSTMAVSLIWTSLSLEKFKDCIVAENESNGVMNLYFCPTTDYNTPHLSLIYCSAPSHITLYTNQSYVETVTVFKTSSLSSVAVQDSNGNIITESYINVDGSNEMEGDFITQNLLPSESNKYNVGENQSPYKNGYFNALTLRTNSSGNSYGALTAAIAGTASKEGATRLILGNSIKTGNEDNASGSIGLYGSGAGQTNIYPSNNTDETISQYLPNKSGTLALESDITSKKGVANGLAELDENGKVPASQLPSYVDDVIEFTNKKAFDPIGESGKIYVDLSTNLTYRWSGTNYVEISPSLALGETSSTAYRGDRGKIAYEHSQKTSGNPHGVTKGDVGLGNVDNTSDMNKPISTAQQEALNNKLGKTENATSATKLQTARKIDGVTFDGSSDISHYGTCPTTGNTAEKVVSCTGFNLVNGATIKVKFDNSNTANAISLNVNSTGAKYVKYGSGTINSGQLKANCIYEFVYDSSSDSYFLEGELDTNKTYSTATSSVAGVVKIGYTQSDKNYPVQLNNSGQMYVNVPWTDTDTKYTHPTTPGNKHIPSGGSLGQILRWSEYGTAVWGDDNNTDTLNTAGSSDTNKKIFLIGAETQTFDTITHSHDTAYVGTDGHLYSDSKQVVNLSSSQALTNKTYNGYTLGDACAKGVDVSVTEGSENLISSGAVYKAINNIPTSVTGDYLPLTGGKLTLEGLANLKFYRQGTDVYVGHTYEHDGGVLGAIAMNTVDGGIKRVSSDYKSFYTVLDTGNYTNYALSKNGGEINGSIIPKYSISHNLGSTTKPFYIEYLKTLALRGNDSGTTYGGLTAEITGTTSVTGVSRLILGNDTKKGTDNNASGAIRMFGSGAGQTNISTSNNTDNNVQLYFPDKSGTLALEGVPLFSGKGTNGTAGYIAFAQLKVTGTYVNRPIEFVLSCRGKTSTCNVCVLFSSSSSTDPNIASVKYFGSDYGVFAHKVDTSTWLLYHTKTEAYDSISVLRAGQPEQSVTITYPGTFITEKPTENIVDSTVGGAVYHSLYSDFATKDSKNNVIVDTYFPKTGGTITGDAISLLTINRSSEFSAAIGFQNTKGLLGYIGMSAINGGLRRFLADTSAGYTILDEGNMSNYVIPRTGGELDGNITPSSSLVSNLGQSTKPFNVEYIKTIALRGGSSSQSYGALNVNTVGTTNTEGIVKLALGNNLASGTADNAKGSIEIYGSNTKKTTINPSNTSSDVTVTLPSKSGTLATLNDIPSTPSAIGVKTYKAGTSSEGTEHTIKVTGTVFGTGSTLYTQGLLRFTFATAYTTSTSTYNYGQYVYLAKNLSGSDSWLPTNGTTSASLPGVKVTIDCTGGNGTLTQTLTFKVTCGTHGFVTLEYDPNIYSLS